MPIPSQSKYNLDTYLLISDTYTYMQSLSDIMGNKNFDEPRESVLIKDYVRKHFQSDVGVYMQTHSITITTPSSGLAGALRPMLHKLKKELDTDKKLFIRIG